MYSFLSFRTWKPYSEEVRDMAHAIIHLWMMCGDTALEHHMTTFAFLKINTRLKDIAEYHAKWLYERYPAPVIIAMWPKVSLECEFVKLVEYYLAKSVSWQFAVHLIFNIMYLACSTKVTR